MLPAPSQRKGVKLAKVPWRKSLPAKCPRSPIVMDMIVPNEILIIQQGRRIFSHVQKFSCSVALGAAAVTSSNFSVVRS